MNRSTPLLLLALLLGATVLGVHAGESRPTDPTAKLAFLAGDWESRTARDSFRAHYSTPEGGLVLGVSKSLEKGQAVFFEFEVFRAEGAELVLQPYPGAKAAASFRSTKLTSTQVVFANPSNDFPSEIVYAAPTKDRLEITLRGKGQEQRFVLTRVKR
jgi:hypothetical protein